MIFFYALGGGLGHFLRARAVLNTFFFGKPALILSSCKRAEEFPPLPGTALIKPPIGIKGQVFVDWLEGLFQLHSPELLCVDAFPLGLFGEIPGLAMSSVKKKFLFARLINFPAYHRACGKASFLYDRAYLCETLTAMHLRELSRYSIDLREIELIEPHVSSHAYALPRRPFWLVDHSGSLEELESLLEYQRELARLEQFEGQTFIHSIETGLSLLPHEALSEFLFTPLLYPFASRIFTACGFHAMREAQQFPEKHSFVPFERKFDDQFIRAALYTERRKQNAGPPLFDLGPGPNCGFS